MLAAERGRLSARLLTRAPDDVEGANLIRFAPIEQVRHLKPRERDDTKVLADRGI